MTSSPPMEYVRLGASGLKVSRVILGAMSYGTPEWQEWVLDEEKSLPLLKHAYDVGLNTWDTADIYSHGMSEKIIGKALKQYEIPRNKVVILSKCYFGVNETGRFPQIGVETNVNDGDMVNRQGLSRKHILDAVDKSVGRLGTYIDVLQIHRLDRSVPIEEIMKALNDVVESGKVRYIGASSMATWEFQMLQNIAEKHGWHKFISMQNYYNLIYREEEREMIPYCKATGVGLIPWSPIARGALARPFNSRETIREKTDQALTRLIRNGESAIDEAIIGRVEELAKKKNVSMATIATAWCLVKGVIPIIGLNSIERIDAAVANVKFASEGGLTKEDIKFLDEQYSPKNIKGY